MSDRLVRVIIVALTILVGCGTSPPGPAPDAAPASPTSKPTSAPAASPTPSARPAPSSSPTSLVAGGAEIDKPLAPEAEEAPTWYLEILTIDGDIKERMEPTSWRQGCLFNRIKEDNI